MLKSELRLEYTKRRAELSEIDFTAKSMSRTVRLLNRIVELAVKDVYIFLPIDNKREFDCRPMAKLLWSKGFRTYIPVADFSTKQMYFSKYSADTVLDEKAYGIIEPRSPVKFESDNSIVITPLLVTDTNLYRVGYGGGFYDRFFNDHPKLYKIGVSFFTPITAIDDINDFDIKLDEVIY